MTTTAKILVVLNLLLAVLFLGFSAATYQARINAEGRITSLEKEKKAKDDLVAVEQQSANKADAESKNLAEQLRLKTKELVEEKKQSTNQIDNLTADNFQYRKQ